MASLQTVTITASNGAAAPAPKSNSHATNDSSGDFAAMLTDAAPKTQTGDQTGPKTKSAADKTDTAAADTGNVPAGKTQTKGVAQTDGKNGKKPQTGDSANDNSKSDQTQVAPVNIDVAAQPPVPSPSDSSDGNQAETAGTGTQDQAAQIADAATQSAQIPQTPATAPQAPTRQHDHSRKSTSDSQNQTDPSQQLADAQQQTPPVQAPTPDASAQAQQMLQASVQIAPQTPPPPANSDTLAVTDVGKSSKGSAPQTPASPALTDADADDNDVAPSAGDALKTALTTSPQYTKSANGTDNQMPAPDAPKSDAAFTAAQENSKPATHPGDKDPAPAPSTDTSNTAPQSQQAQSAPGPAAPPAPPAPTASPAMIAAAAAATPPAAAGSNAASNAAANTNVAVNVHVAPTPNVNSLAVEIAARSLSGAKEFQIRLDPPELGRVEVRLSIDATGKTEAHMTADQPQTLSLLQKDSGTLTRALRDAGLDVSQGSLNFSLKGQDRQSGDSNGGAQTRSPSRLLTATQTIDAVQSANAYRSSAGNARLDIHV